MFASMKLISITDEHHHQLRTRAMEYGLKLKRIAEIVIQLGLDRPMKSINARKKKGSKCNLA
mgnify:CR=1 FL=1